MMTECNFADTAPHIHAISVFCAQSDTKNSEKEKNQYQYRLMLLHQGEAIFSCMGSKTALKQNSILFLPPDCPYSMKATTDTFSLLSVWFSFDGGTTDAPYETVAQSAFSKEMAHRLSFSDADAFNRAFLWMPSAYSAKSILKIWQEYNQQDDVAKSRADALLFLFLSDTLRSLPSQKEKETVLQVKEILSYIQAHLCDKTDCADIAEHFHCHPNHLNRLIKQETGESAKQYILQEKMRYARSLLAETDLSPSEVAQRLGFFDYSHFSKCYKKYS